MDEPIPPWVPEISPGVHADVYPVDPVRHPQNPYFQYPAELRLDRAAVINGYAERRLPYEFASRLPTEGPPSLSSSPPQHQTPTLTQTDLSKLKNGLVALRRARPNKLQRVQVSPPSNNNNPQTAPRSFPLQKPPLSQTLDDWFNRLSKGSHHPLSELSRSVPLGPAIVRAARKVIEMMATSSISTQRAAWYIRIAVLNECVKQMRPDRPPPSPKLFWTKQLCSLLKTEIEAFRARKMAMLGRMERVTFWNYVLDLARWQADEGLLDVSKWITAIAHALREELISMQSFSSPGTKITVMAARRFLPEFLSSPDAARVLLDALLTGAGFIIKASRASGNAARESAKSKNTPRKISKRTALPSPTAGPAPGAAAVSTANECHVEIMHLLATGLKAMQVSVPPVTDEFNMATFERLVRKAADTIQASRDRRKEKDPKPDYRTKEEKMMSPNLAIRQFEMLSAHGDVARVVSILRAAYRERGGTPMAVRKVCEWTLSPSVPDRAEAICVACAVFHRLAAESASSATSSSRVVRNGANMKRSKKGIHPTRTPALSSKPGNLNGTQAPPLQRDIWHFIKQYANLKVPDTTDRDETDRDDAVVNERSRARKPESLDEDDSIVRFIAHLCRHELLSLPAFVRDVSRLSAVHNPGTAFLVKCLSLLPDPVDKSTSDCRRSILRKYGFHSSSKSSYPHGVCEKSLAIAGSGDASLMAAQVDALGGRGATNVIMSTIDALCQQDLTSMNGDVHELHRKLTTMVSFMVSLGEAATAVEWVMDSLDALVENSPVWKSSVMKAKRRSLSVSLARLISNLSRYIAASGYLEKVFMVFKAIWCSAWLDSDLETELLRTLSSFARYCGSRIIPSPPFWMKMAAKNLKHFGEDAKGLSCIPLALACMRGQEDYRKAGSSTLNEVLNLSNRENLGVSADDDVAQLCSRAVLNGIQISQLRACFAGNEGSFVVDDLFRCGFNANDILGSVLIPVLKHSLLESGSLETPVATFSQLSAKALHLIESNRNDVRFQGIRPAILLEFVTLLFCGCYYGHTNSSESLEVLFAIKWVWKILAPYSSIELAKRLRVRADFYCGRLDVDKTELSASLFNMISRLCGQETGGDEETVLKSIGSTPFGEVEMLLALLAQHRRESGGEDDFGLKVSGQATLVMCKHSARTLVAVALRCCAQDVSRQSVAGYVVHQASHGMQESLTYVLRGLTVEAYKNNEVHRERSLQWCQMDAARRGLLETAIASLKAEHAVDVEAALFEQLSGASRLLSEALTEGRAPSSIVEDGELISDALESRLLCILRCPRMSVHAERWRQRAQEVAELLKSGIGIMTGSAIAAACNLLDLCLRSMRDSSTSADEHANGIAVNQVLEWPENQELKRQLEATLVAAMRWVEPAERAIMAKLIPRRMGYGSGLSRPVKVLKGDGSVVDNWILLEGYGRGADEESAIGAEDMWRQGDSIVDRESAIGTVHLKRTYSTFASLAV
ncbi:hypothetical protein BWQ96_04053 [Gracilariopsis chorda]|uniref:Mediator complex subunit Med12 domain-containing protein n=1 Tax=Gracilariopsis chorda TaxID=448386 RepID=A0A2V3IVK3_9FLOR|nr:hypothetical protein BWQ96_04053 [Gracilariopsis chorda]|eukprot:PXF46176.1 hypothetical protein BWQ96_04053 [Gracilariopsis chorda]